MKKQIPVLAALACLLCLTALPAGADAPDAKQAILEGVRARQETIDLSGCTGIPEEGAGALFQQVCAEHPELFYLTGSCRWQTGSSGTRVMPEYDPRYGDEQVAQYEAAVQAALAGVSGELTGWQAALALHDYLAQHCAYDTEGYRSGSGGANAYNALVEGSAVCEGYSRAYADLLGRVGLSAGFARSEAMDHVWNVVCLNGAWYHVDVTWDDALPDLPGGVRHDYFLLSDDGIRTAGIAESKHCDWQADVACTDDAYDTGCFWTSTKSAVLFDGAETCYYLRDSAQEQCRQITLVRRDGPTGKETVLYQQEAVWDVPGENRYWLGVYSSLARGGDGLYFNGPQAVYRFSAATGTVETVYENAREDARLYGLMIRDGAACVSLAASPQEAGRNLETLALPGLETPAPAPAAASAPAAEPDEAPGSDAPLQADARPADDTDRQVPEEEADARPIDDTDRPVPEEEAGVRGDVAVIAVLAALALVCGGVAAGVLVWQLRQKEQAASRSPYGRGR